jgi:cell wall-associated NlpC family hydrolase
MGGIDCSGLTMRAYQAAGIQLPHWDDKQMNYGTPVDNPAPGDLVFFQEHAGQGPTTHVALYYGNGKILHASSSYGEVVISDMKYLEGYVSARRLL